MLAFLFAGKALSSPWAFEALIFVTFFLASAGASAAYLTVSEIFPMETRALAIAFFYAVGTGARRDRRAAAVREADRDERPDMVDASRS